MADVRLTAVKDDTVSYIGVVKTVRAFTLLGLQAAVELVKPVKFLNTPTVVARDLTDENARKMIADIESYGGKADIESYG